MKENTAECLLSALLKIIWRRGCPRILYSDRGGNLLSLLAHKVYERLGINKATASAYHHNSSGMCERAIQTLLALLSCDMSDSSHHSGWLERLPPLIWAMNTAVCAGTGYSPFYLEHGREPRDVPSRAMDTAGLQPSTRPWVDLMSERLSAARTAHRTVDLLEKDKRRHVAALPHEARRQPPALPVGSYAYYQVARYSRHAEDGTKLVPTWTGPFLIRSTVVGSDHRYLLAIASWSLTRRRPSYGSRVRS